MLGPLLSLKLARSNDLLFTKGHHTVLTPDTNTGSGTAHGTYSMSSTYNILCCLLVCMLHVSVDRQFRNSLLFMNIQNHMGSNRLP